ncbi:MAG: putative selenium-dependent hydroxylase accessory protein YqeC [Firmicutes bacterium]|nr:putative selenium-dependent hydroxylase accessory protein YqeC [Bacillota bacterium]
MDLYHLLDLDMENQVCLSLCGAGGKTTLLYALVREANLYGKKASLLTTALLKTPHEEDMFVFYGYGSKWMHKVWKFRQIIVAGGSAGRGLLNEADQATIDFQLRYADLVAVKADYSEGHPLKWPLEGEPRILPATNRTFVMMGLTALGKPFDEVCQHAAAAREALGTEQELVDEELLAQLIWQGYGRLSPWVFLNQADDAELKARGERVAARLRELGLPHVVVDSLQERGLTQEFPDMPTQVNEHGYH